MRLSGTLVLTSTHDPARTLWKCAILGSLLFFLLTVLYVLTGCSPDNHGESKNYWQFPIHTYFDDHASLAGLKFQATLRVEADLGWKKDAGRIIVFIPVDDSRRITAHIPPNLSGVHFQRGERYKAEVSVGEGGQIQVLTVTRE